MNENDKRNVNDDDTDSFEAMEKRMRTPVKKLKTQTDIDMVLEGIQLPSGEEDKENIAVTESIQTFSEINQVETIADTSPIEEPKPIEEDITPLPSTPLGRSRSLSCLATEEQEEVQTLATATSALHLGQQVQLSGLVPTHRVEEVLDSLEEQEQELTALRKEQDQLSKKTEEVLEKVRWRREQFKQLWGVSPLKIMTKKTVLPRRKEETKQELGLTKVEEEKQEALKEDLELSLEETGVVPLPFTPAARKVRFDSGHNATHALTPLDTPPCRSAGSFNHL